ncbi:MAG TPA: sulfotransferase [Gammaproteobacteria bacterium]
MTAARPYGGVERILHRLAFAGIPAQLALADVEQRLYRSELSADGSARPVFITALPRAGTTLLLELLSRLPEFAAHTYRQMPFVLCPLIWERLSRGFRRSGRAQERAHGDGIRIDYDSPEAFEEIVWKAHWPEKYRRDRIEPWSSVDRNPVFEDFLHQHMRSIVALQAAERAPVRYISKNNANIGRIGLLTALFPDCRIVVPVRDPWNHAASMLRQHRRFLSLHAEDGFARRYMEWLGHHEFGGNLKPIDFDGWLARSAARDTGSLRFWLGYWHKAYSAIDAECPGNVVLVDYESLCRAPAAVLRQLARALEIDAVEALVAQSRRLRTPTRYDRTGIGADAETAERIHALHHKLRAACIGGIA